MDSSNSDVEFDTQTPNPTSSGESPRSSTISPQVVWGRLFPRTIYLPPVDLNKQYILLGRAADCDIVLTKNNFSPTSLTTVSKNHFMITRGEKGQSIYIKDLSKNGTFVNGTIVGCGKTIILENDDEIAVGTARQRVYIYKTIENGKTPFLPQELKAKYEISRVLGTGACGEVRLAFEKTTFKEYAIKRIIKNNTSVQPALNNPLRIESEVKILQSLSHPCIVSTKEILETEKAVFIVLEYMEGGELTDLMHLTGDPLPEIKAKLLFYQMVVAVQYLHSRGITHRDLKPGNVLLKSNNSDTLIKISDFGLSKVLKSDAFMSTVVGTPSFVAPEVIDARYTVYTKEIDVWSLGVMLFYMLSNELPFKLASDGNHRDLYILILTGEHSMTNEHWNVISENAKDLVNKMLVRNPNDRITVQNILDHPWIAEDLDMQRRARELMDEETESSDRNTKKRKLENSQT